ncbi:33K [Bovine mastadenovirus A]|uniref:33K n=1 Tax=Bovine mastadenovirus A TaxID=129953 RepID=UPI0000443F96|nr:33K [Bovine mastadenovirus A]
MPRAVRPTSLNLTKPKSRKKAAPEPPPPTPDEETLESIPGEDVEEEWDDIDSLVAEESEMEDEELEDGETSVSELLKKDQPPPLPPKTRKAPKQRRWDQTPTSAPGQNPQKKSGKRTIQSASTSAEPATTQELRAKIFPTLYAIFQQSRGGGVSLKIKNRSLRSLTKSCLYHKQESQLQRTLEDAEALLQKYCSGLRGSAPYISAQHE